MFRPRICANPECRKKFQPKDSRSLYCSHKCRICHYNLQRKGKLESSLVLLSPEDSQHIFSWFEHLPENQKLALLLHEYLKQDGTTRPLPETSFELPSTRSKHELKTPKIPESAIPKKTSAPILTEAKVSFTQDIQKEKPVIDNGRSPSPFELSILNRDFD